MAAAGFFAVLVGTLDLALSAVALIAGALPVGALAAGALALVVAALLVAAALLLVVAALLLVVAALPVVAAGFLAVRIMSSMPVGLLVAGFLPSPDMPPPSSRRACVPLLKYGARASSQVWVGFFSATERPTEAYEVR